MDELDWIYLAQERNKGWDKNKKKPLSSIKAGNFLNRCGKLASKEYS
jgi:hypothetical protein